MVGAIGKGLWTGKYRAGYGLGNKGWKGNPVFG